MAVSYRIIFADLISNTIREEIPVSNLKWSTVLNAPGAMSGWVSMDHPKCIRTNLDPGATAVYIDRGGLLVWGGILWTALPSTANRQLQIGAEGFWSYFRRRLIRTTKTYVAADQLAIAQDLVNYAQAQPNGSIGVAVGSETSGTLRDRTYYQYDRKNLAQAVEELAAVIGGFDFSIEVAWDATQTIPVKTLRFYFPRRGARLDGLVFNGNVDDVSDFTVPTDATGMANLVDAIGTGTGDATVMASAADTSMPQYPLLEKTVAYKDVSVPATLTAHAQADLARSRFPIETPTISKQATSFPEIGAFQVGDEGIVRASDGWISINSYQRVQKIEVAVGDEGQETMIPAFVSADATVA